MSHFTGGGCVRPVRPCLDPLVVIIQFNICREMNICRGPPWASVMGFMYVLLLIDWVGEVFALCSWVVARFDRLRRRRFRNLRRRRASCDRVLRAGVHQLVHARHQLGVEAVRHDSRQRDVAV